MPVVGALLLYSAIKNLTSGLLVSFYVFECALLILRDVTCLALLLVFQIYYGDHLKALADGFNMGFLLAGVFIVVELVSLFSLAIVLKR